jgi:hypothetical protein
MRAPSNPHRRLAAQLLSHPPLRNTPPPPSLPTTTSRLNHPRSRSRPRPHPHPRPRRRRHAEFCRIDQPATGHVQSPGLTARRSPPPPCRPRFIRLSSVSQLRLSALRRYLRRPHLTSPPRPPALGTLPPPSIRPGPGHKFRIPRCMRLTRATTSSHPSAPSAHPRRPCEVCRPAPDHDMLYQPYFTSTLRPDGIAATRRPSWILYTSPNSRQIDISRN